MNEIFLFVELQSIMQATSHKFTKMKTAYTTAVGFLMTLAGSIAMIHDEDKTKPKRTLVIGGGLSGIHMAFCL